MKSFVCFWVAVLFATTALAWPPPPAPSGWIDNGTTTSTTRSVVIGGSNPITSTGVEYEVWSIQDTNGDKVARMTVECSNITDGSQVCHIHFYVMSDPAGTLTEEWTIDVDTD